jgi:quercetin dioxygenase-like cupin family protein
MVIRKTNGLPFKKFGDVRKKLAIGLQEGARNFAMRIMELDSGRSSPYHSHDWEHEVYVLEGEGEVVVGNTRSQVYSDDAIFIPANENHSFVNTGKEVLRYICVVPLKGEEG